MLELIWSRQDTTVGATGAGDPDFDLDVHYLHIGGMVPFTTSNDRLEALLSRGAGATFMRPGIDGAGSETLLLAQRRRRPSVSRLGPGRDPARGSRVVTPSPRADGAIFCAGGCVIAFSGGGFGQGELTAGLQLSF